jgi:hypothetical protein
MKSISKAEAPLSFVRRLAFVLITAGLIVAVILVGAELLVRWLNPQVIIYPKWNFSYQYGQVLPPDRRMHHYYPGHWHYV